MPDTAEGKPASRPRALGRTEWWLIGGLGVVLAATIAAVVFALSLSPHAKHDGCIHVNLPYAAEGQGQFLECGESARTMCGAVGRPGGLTGITGQTVAAECRRAGVPIGPGGGRG